MNLRFACVLVPALLAGCATRPDAAPREAPTSGLLPVGFKVEPSTTTLARLAPDAGIVLIPARSSDATLNYFDAFDQAVRGDTPDLFGFLAQHRASEDPKNSVLLITRALKRCFGDVLIAPDFPSAMKLKGGAIAVVGIRVNYPFFGAWTANYDVQYFDRELKLIHAIAATGSMVPPPFHHTVGLVVQERAAADFQRKLASATSGRCT